MKRVMIAVAGGLAVVWGGIIYVASGHHNGPVDIKCGEPDKRGDRPLYISARWVDGGELFIPDSVLRMPARELKNCELDGHPIKIPWADGGTR